MSLRTTLIALLLLPTLLAQTTAPSTRPADPAAEIRQLRAENAELRAQIESLKKQIAAKPPAASQPATRPAKNFNTMQEILANCPPDLNPKPNPDWYKFTE